MKRINLIIIVILILTHLNLDAFGQSTRTTMAIGDIDAKDIFIGTKLNALPELVILEMNKIDKYDLLDQYDMRYLAKRDSIEIKGCYSKICLAAIGKQLHVDKMLSGSILNIGDNITVTFRLLDVATGTIDKSQTNEFLNITTEIRKMIEITLSKTPSLP